MLEAVFNSAGLSVQFRDADDALEALDEVVSGLILLSSKRHIANHLWMKDEPYEVIACEGTSLSDLFRAYLGKNKDRGLFLLRMATRCPIDNGIHDTHLKDFLDCEIDGFPDCTDLLWCAVSGTKIAISLSSEDQWHHNPLALRIVRDEGRTTISQIENFFSNDSARDTIDRLNALKLTKISATDLWAGRGDLFPNLLFGADVEKQLQSLGADYFSSAVERIVELEKAASDWNAAASPSPAYLSKITGESEATMQKYGHERVFRSSSGENETYEKHARLHNGARIHLREIREVSKIGIGYIGKHLSIVSTG